MDEVWEALADPNVRVVAQVAPAVRVAVGDHYGLTKGRSVMGKIVNALHLMGFDEVYDTSFSADLTIMEESAEFLDRIKKGEKLPLLTSCCHGMGQIRNRSVQRLYSEPVHLPFPAGNAFRGHQRVFP